MQKLKSGVLVSILTIGIMTTAMANQNTAVPVQPFTDTDIQLIFKQDNQPMELAALSPKEMRETEGAVGPWGALGGAAVGGIFYTGHAIGSGSWSWGSFATSVGMGALTGFSGGAAAGYFVPRIAFGAGIISGRNGW